MKYITFTFEKETYWIELDHKNYAHRQIRLLSDGSSLISCRDDCLAEGIVIIDENTLFISEEDFEIIWSRYSSVYADVWEKEKGRYPLGKRAAGTIRYFYPQGIIIDFGEIQGISDYDVCRKNSRPENLYPGHKITGTVTDYDDKNMWIVISDSTAL